MRVMLQIYRRHAATCPHAPKGRAFHKCKCPIWVDNGKSGPARIRHSLDTTIWTKANELLRDMELGIERERFAPRSVLDACEAYLADCHARGLAGATIRKARAVLIGSKVSRMAAFRKAPALAVWAGQNGVRVMSDWSQAALERYRASWTDASISALKRLDLIRGFFGWAVDHGMVLDNYAAKLRRPKPRPEPTLPYSREEFQALLDACLEGAKNEPVSTAPERARLRTLLLVMRYTGLRVSDALQLDDQRTAGGRVRLHQHKTGEWVHIPLPGWLSELLASTPRASAARWFMKPGQSIKNAHERWRRKLAKVAKLAGVADPGFHRLRDTFAVELILAGVSLDRVSVLLGHTSVRMTEKHYAPWIRARQQQLDEQVLQAWAVDPVAQREQLMGGIGAVRN